MNKHILRCLTWILCLCLMPLGALADINDGTPVTRSDFTLTMHLDKDAWPQSDVHFEDWQAFLKKLSFMGTTDTQSFLDPYSRVCMDLGLYVNDQLAVPFEYDGYHSFRYLRSPAFAGASIHFQMFNFFQFMLKGYYFMGLCTQQIAPLLYPEATTKLDREYLVPIRELTNGEGERTIESADLYELCEGLNMIAIEDERDHLYYYFTSLLIELGANEIVLEKLQALESILDTMDPDGMGLTIMPGDDGEIWTLGEDTVYETDASGFRICLREAEGYELNLKSERNGEELKINLDITLDGEDRLHVHASMDGLSENGLNADGRITFDVGGAAFYEQPAPVTFAYHYSRSAEKLPFSVQVTVDYVNPETDMPAIGFTYTADMSDIPVEMLHDRPIDNQDDFFHLNESFMAEYKERFLPTMALAAVPVVLECPVGVMDDIIAFMNETGFLAFLGIE